MGISQTTLLDGTGLSPASIQNAPGYIPAEQLYALWNNIIRLSGKETFGLHAAENVPFGAYRVHDYMFSLSISPRDALERINRSFALITDVFRHSVRQYRDLTYLEFHIAEGPQYFPRPYIEFILANYLVRLRLATQTRFMPIEVHLACRKPRSTREYDRFFNAPVRFHQAVNRLVFPQHLIETRQPLADPELCELLESYARQQLLRLSRGKSFLGEVREALIFNLASGHPTLPVVARQLATSRRGLQREIAAHGMTYRDLLDSVRLEHAMSLLKEKNLPIQEIAVKLNFTDASSFCRAFKRWTGISPLQQRNHADG